jgi:hypothetical protein
MQRIGTKLFINYRSEDAGTTASRLFQDLERALAPGQVFLDHERIEGGDAWPDRLRDEVLTASAIFCLIGKRWLTASDPETGDRRLNLPEDWVRREIEASLERQIPIVPVLIDDAGAPSRRAFQTVPSLAPLAELQWLPLRRKEWRTDLEALVLSLENHGFAKLEQSHATPDAAVRRAAEYAPAIARYRRRVSGLFDRWDLSSVGVAQSGTTGGPIEVQLDDMYLALRIG